MGAFFDAVGVFFDHLAAVKWAPLGIALALHLLKLVFRAIALTSAVYVISVNRPHPESGVLIGGPSIAVDPNGNVLVETTDPLDLVTLESTVVDRARKDYPGYLPIRADLYGAAWEEVSRRSG